MISMQRILEKFCFWPCRANPYLLARFFWVSETGSVLVHEDSTRKRGCKVVTRIMAVRSKYSELPGIVSSFKPQYLIIPLLNGEFTQLILYLDNF